jgi:arabinan endo-1,5-alpha-L-arabinosidase
MRERMGSWLNPNMALSRRLLILLIALAPLLVGWADGVQHYRNPVLDRDFPDPTVVHVGDRYYAYATQSGTRNIQVSSSDDLVHWSRPHEALPDAAEWAQNNNIFWAPHMTERDGTFYLYYSASPDESEFGFAICLAVATSDDPLGPFTDVGLPLYCGDTTSDIDPDVFHDPTTDAWFIYWGSGGDIVGAPLGDDMISLDDDPTRLLRGWNSQVDRPYEHGIEGPWVAYHRGWYYLFYSGDRCCEYPPHYAPMVARSREPLHGFERQGPPHMVVLGENRRWAGPGHNSIVVDERGRWWFVYHAIDRTDPYLRGNIRRVMLIDRLRFRDGWPVVANGTPSNGPRRAPHA